MDGFLASVNDPIGLESHIFAARSIADTFDDVFLADHATAFVKVYFDFISSTLINDYGVVRACVELVNEWARLLLEFP